MGRGRGGSRGGGSRGEGRRGGGGDHEDQYGGFGSQDRDDRPSFSQKSGTGGGSGGSQTRHKGPDLAFQRHVPKFLQSFAHMLGGKKDANNEDGGDEDAPVVVGGAKAGSKRGAFDGWSEDEDDTRGGKGNGGIDEDIEEDALRRAMEENPELAAEFEGKLTEKLNQARAKEEKDNGNRAFGAKKYLQAVESFTKCIELDKMNEVYWSNRSAAHAALEDWEAAAVDARQAVKLKPKWAKAHSRLAVAFYGLKLYSDAVESYKRALDIEPDDQALQKGLQKAQMMELQQIQSHKHVFFNKKQKLAAPDVGHASTSGKKVGGGDTDKAAPASEGHHVDRVEGRSNALVVDKTGTGQQGNEVGRRKEGGEVAAKAHRSVALSFADD